MLYRVLSAMKSQNDQARRYKLQRIGESLIGSYLDLEAGQVKKLIDNLEDHQPAVDGAS